MLYEKSWKFAKPIQLITNRMRCSIIPVRAPSQLSATIGRRWAMRLPLAISSMEWTWTRHLSSPASKQVVSSLVQVVKRRSIMPTSSSSPSCYFASLSWSVWACKNFEGVHSFLRRWVQTFEELHFTGQFRCLDSHPSGRFRSVDCHCDHVGLGCTLALEYSKTESADAVHSDTTSWSWMVDSVLR